MGRLFYFALGFLAGMWVSGWLERDRDTFVEQWFADPGREFTPVKNEAPAGRLRTAVQAPDDFSQIKGIGPAFAQALNEIGIHTFADLSRETAQGLADKLPVRVYAERIEREAWIEQARRLKGKG
jgi:predicted flap endonuclease-1-like 5' DNA nuclease